MAKRVKRAADDTPKGFYDERLIEWRDCGNEVYEAANLAAPDYAMVAHAHYPGGDRRWMFKAMNGALVDNAAKGNVLIERQYSGVGGAQIIVNAFNAQQLAIQCLNRWRAMPQAPASVMIPDAAAVFEDVAGASEPILSIAEPVVVGVDVAVDATQAELSGAEVLRRQFPRVVDPFTGKEVPADDVAAAQTIPNPAALEEKLDDSSDEIEQPKPRRGRKRQ